MNWVTTTTLLRELREFSNETAWERFVGRFRGPVVGFAMSMGVPRPDADDVAQEALSAFAQAYRDGKYDRERGRLRAWLFGIAYRQALKQRARARRADAVDIDIEQRSIEWEGSESAALDVWNRGWERILLQECLIWARKSCPADSFRAFELVVLDGRSAAEAAHIMGVPIKKVYNGKHRVLARIRQYREDLKGVERTDEVS